MDIKFFIDNYVFYFVLFKNLGIPNLHNTLYS